VNPVEETPIQLPGRGFCFKPSGNYRPGEYAALDNVDISSDGTLIGRRGLMFGVRRTADPINNGAGSFTKFIGSYKDRVIIATTDNRMYEQKWDSVNSYWSSELLSLVDPISILGALPAPAPVGANVSVNKIQFEGFWTYNGFNYLLVLHTHVSWTTVVAASRDWHMHQRLIVIKKPITYTKAALPNIIVEAINFQNVVVGDCVVVNDRYDTKRLDDPGSNESLYSGVNGWPTHYVKNHFIFKERIWIATEDTLFGSKATDPFVWASPDGFFIKYPGQEIKCAVALENGIDIFCDSSIYSFGYDIDPNTDASNILISNGLGAESAVVVGDTVYFVKDDSLYGLTGNNPEKVLDLQIQDELTPDNASNQSFIPKLGYYDDALYLILQKVNRGVSTVNNPFKGESAKYQAVNAFVYRISLTNSSVSRITVEESFQVRDPTIRVRPCDMYFVTTEGFSNQNFLFIAFQTSIYLDDTLFAFPLQNYTTKTYNFVDTICDPDVNLTKVKVAPRVLIRVYDWAPDENKYYYRKYRQALITADLSEPDPAASKLKLRIYAGAIIRTASESSITSNPFKTVDMEERSSVTLNNVGYRVGINQRAAVLSFEFVRDPVNAEAADGDSRLEISDFRILWTPTVRGPKHNVNELS
jgi:hypothetical protein